MEPPVDQEEKLSEMDAYLASRLKDPWTIASSATSCHNPSIPQNLATFTVFPNFPPELRSRIWEFACRQPWIFHMIISEEKFEFLDNLPPIPGALHASSEARKEGLKHGAIIQRYRLDRADYAEVYGPWPESGRPPPPVPAAGVGILGGPPGILRRQHQPVRPCARQFFYTNFVLDQYILSVESFPEAYPTFRLQEDFYLPSDVPTGLPNPIRQPFPALEDAIIPPIFGNIRHLVLGVSLEGTSLPPHDSQFAQCIARATREFTRDYVMPTVQLFPRVESISFLIKRQTRTVPTTLGFPFDGDQELRTMDQVPILPGDMLLHAMGRETLTRLEIEFWISLGNIPAINSDPFQNLKFVMKVPKSLPRTMWL